MYNNKSNLSYIDTLFFLALILITFNIFPFEKYGLGSSKPLSLVPLILYVICNVFKYKLYVEKRFILEIVLIILVLLISLGVSTLIYHDYSGFLTAVSMWICYLIIFVSLYYFAYQANREKLKYALLCIYFSFKISFCFGLLELIYFYVVPSDIISEFIQLFVRDDMYLNGKRLQFNFGEPGDSGALIVCLLFPTLIMLKRLGYTFIWRDKVIIGGIILMQTLFSSSVTFIVLLTTYAVFYLYFSYKRLLDNSKKWLLFFLLLIIGFVIVLMKNDVLSNYVDDSDIRILRLLSNSSEALKNDASSATRIGLWVISWDIFKENLFFGCGWGNFGFVFHEALSNMDSLFLTEEMLNKYDQHLLQTYSIISTSMVEGGFVGILWLLVFMSRFRRNIGFVRPFIPVILIYSLQSMIIYNVAICVAIFMLTDRRVQYLIGINENNMSDK